MQFNANIRISEQEISSLLEYFLQRAKVYWRFISTIRISEQKHETCFNVFTASMSIFEIFFSTIRISEQKHTSCEAWSRQPYGVRGSRPSHSPGCSSARTGNSLRQPMELNKMDCRSNPPWQSKYIFQRLTVISKPPFG